VCQAPLRFGAFRQLAALVPCHVTVPKGGRLRYVPMTMRLATALREHRHLRSPRVVCLADGSCLSADGVKTSRGTRSSPCSPQRERCSSPQAHVLLASGDAWGTSEGDSGTRRSQRPLDNAAIHAPKFRSHRRRNSTARWRSTACGRGKLWGNGFYRVC